MLNVTLTLQRSSQQLAPCLHCSPVSTQCIRLSPPGSAALGTLTCHSWVNLSLHQWSRRRQGLEPALTRAPSANDHPTDSSPPAIWFPTPCPAPPPASCSVGGSYLWAVPSPGLRPGELLFPQSHSTQGSRDFVVNISSFSLICFFPSLSPNKDYELYHESGP